MNIRKRLKRRYKTEERKELLKLLEKIKNKTIIVEGKRDKQVLCSYGFTNVVTLERGIYETAEKVIESKEVIILTDFDSEGKEIAGKLNFFLQSLGCKVDRVTRRKISFLFSKLGMSSIEELKRR